MAEHSGEKGTHHIVSVPVRSPLRGIVAWRFSCSCGREGNNWHSTPEAAVAAGDGHLGRST